MTYYQTNGSPAWIPLGTDDKSIKKVFPRKIPLPQALPKFVIYAKKGPFTDQLVGGPEALSLYGIETFNQNSDFYTHQTRFVNGCFGEGGVAIIKRVPGSAPGVEANKTIYLDVLATNIPNYQRNQDGSYAKDANGEKVLDTENPEITGYKVKYIAEEHTPDTLITEKNGTMAGSTMYPLVTVRAYALGKAYNDIGFSIHTPDMLEVEDIYISDAKFLPFRFSIVDKSTGVIETVRNLYNEQDTQFTLKQKGLNPRTEERMDLKTRVDNRWKNLTDPTLLLRHPDLTDITVFYDHIEVLQTMFMTSEAPFITDDYITRYDGNVAASSEWFDFTTTDATELIEKEKFLFNIINMTSLSKVPYHSVIKDETIPTITATQTEVQLSRNTPIFLTGGSDGVFDMANFDMQVGNELMKYLDPDDRVQNIATNPDSMMIDTGFPLTIKKLFANYIALRKDTFSLWTTQVWDGGNTVMSLADMRAMSEAIRTALQLTPESEFYGTPAMRGCIVAGDGLLISDVSQERIPLLFEVFTKIIRMMGASNGKWKKEQLFDTYPNNAIEFLDHIEPEHIGATIKPRLWKSGMIWPENADRETYYLPQHQSVYSEDSSVANNIFMPLAICTLNKAANRVYILNNGDTHSSRGMFADKIVADVNRLLSGAFADMYKIVPRVEFTEEDNANNYSYHLTIAIGGRGMLTQQYYTTETYRIEDLNNKGK